MNQETQQILNAALSLSEEERFELAEAISASSQTCDQPPFDASWHEVIRRRSQELYDGKAVGVPWTDVKRCAWELNGE